MYSIRGEHFWKVAFLKMFFFMVISPIAAGWYETLLH